MRLCPTSSSEGALLRRMRVVAFASDQVAATTSPCAGSEIVDAGREGV